MSVTKKLRLTGSTILFGVAAMSLAGCAADQSAEDYMSEVAARWQQIEMPAENTVETVAFEHVVAFPANASMASDAERRRLRDFVIVSNLTASDTLVLEGPRSASGAYTQATENQIATLRAELADLGLPSYIAAPSGISRSRGQDQVAIVVTRSVAVTPDCDSGPLEPGQRPNYQFGCTNNAALGLMVADPRDLDKGRTLGPADGEKASLALQKYRASEEEEIQVEETD